LHRGQGYLNGRNFGYEKYFSFSLQTNDNFIHLQLTELNHINYYSVIFQSLDFSYYYGRPMA